MARTKDLEALAAEIVGRARREADDIKKAARSEAAAALRRAREEAEAKKRERLAAAGRDAEALVRRATSLAEVEAQRLQFAEREDLIDGVIAEAWQACHAAPKGERRDSLLELAVGAVAALGGGRVTLRLSERDRALVDAPFLARARERLRDAGLAGEIDVAAEAASIAGGVIAVKEGGRVLFDNSFEARLDRLREILRAEVWRILAAEQRRAAA